ncbi:chaperone protein DnaJ-like isoform X4 [Juglans microcarpa x Juglans regia]|uniref:chaperone protein DnaJ-like isoform X4 n=1 Tax=Juglans microcarpa x Juglans regia TaxID=2249226 RepID=UPI001B7E930E|nr:chaperone protein DnaJ-like isoform X4 [Juglans microcarpa x Juglans regia]
MENGEEKSDDFYAVLGLKKECTAPELRNAYKKLALRWHPDRCSASGNSKFVEEAKKKFQAIQRAYSVLSDANKRFLYDVGIYDSDDDENEKGEESFEELQELFEELFQGDIGSFGSSSQTTTCSSSSSSYTSYCETSGSSNKRNSSEMNCGKTNLEDTSASGFDANFQDFCFGTGGTATRCQKAEGGQRSFRRRR